MQRGTDVIARLGGDEFAVIVLDVSRDLGAAETAQKLIDAIQQPMLIEGNELRVTASVGIGMFPTDTDDLDELVKLADIALYDAKAHGKNTFRFYSKDSNVLTMEHLKLENDLRRAVERNELFLEFQPQVDLRTRNVFGVEALVRWQHPELGRLLPGRFIPLAEENGLIQSIGAWVLDEACRQLKAWDAAGLSYLTVSVNLGALEFDTGLLDRIKNILAETGIAPDRLEL
jgi:predicted signal transduction protein with EAL and GGDEF domain